MGWVGTGWWLVVNKRTTMWLIKQGRRRTGGRGSGSNGLFLGVEGTYIPYLPTVVVTVGTKVA